MAKASGGRHGAGFSKVVILGGTVQIVLVNRIDLRVTPGLFGEPLRTVEGR